jgi:hypothetical protein
MFCGFLKFGIEVKSIEAFFGSTVEESCVSSLVDKGVPMKGVSGCLRCCGQSFRREGVKVKTWFRDSVQRRDRHLLYRIG